VQVGTWQGGDWFIDQGLGAGDVVVTDGVARLSPGMPVKAVPASAAPNGSGGNGPGADSAPADKN
jgi:membrane fusion protein (multidrug efflux system)